MKVLIIEDNKDLVSEYLRIFNYLSPNLDVQYTIASNLKEGYEAVISEESWNTILFDYNLGKPFTTAEGTKIFNGAGLIKIRKEYQYRKGLPNSKLIGIAESQALLKILQKAGAEYCFSKIDMEDMIKEIGKSPEEEGMVSSV